MKQLDPKAVWLFFVNSILRAFIPIILISVYSVLFFLESGEGLDTGGELSFGVLNWLWIIIPVFLVLCFVWAKLTYHFYHYELTDAGFRKELGVISKKYVTIPYDRIQNVNIDRGILARILGLSNLQIETAGSTSVGTEASLPGLSIEEAERLRDELIARAGKSKNQGL